MKHLLITLAVLLMLLIPATIIAQPRVIPPGYVEYCYTVLLPVPHTQCELRYVAPVPPVRYNHYRHYRPVPPPPPHHGRHGHHLPPPPPHHGGHHPGPRR